MRVVLIAGPPCSGKTTLVQQLAKSNDAVLDHDAIARHLGSPVRWVHPEPYRTMAERELQAQLLQAFHWPSDGTCWLIRTAPLPATRMAIAKQWSAIVYVLNPGERECQRRARATKRPPGTGRRIGQWFNHYRSWDDDHDARCLLTNHRLSVNE